MLKKENLIVDITYCKNHVSYSKSVVVLVKDNNRNLVVLHHIVPLDIRGHFFFVDEIMTRIIEEISTTCLTCNTLRVYYDIIPETKVIYVHFVLMPPDAVYDAARSIASATSRGAVSPLKVLNKIASNVKFKILLNSERLESLIENSTNTKLLFAIHILLRNLYSTKKVSRKSFRDIVIYRKIV